MNAGSMLEAIWLERAKAFRKETIPYLRYMGQSGFPAFLSLLFIASAISYFQLIRNMPPDFPIVWAGVLALTPVLAWSPMRTFLAPADVVYLMPREHDMGAYLKRSLQSSLMKAVPLAAAVYLIYMPIYVQGESEISPWLLAIAAIAMKGGNAAGAWQERRMAWNGARILLRVLRWAITAISLAVWLTAVWWQAIGFTLLCGLLAFVCVKLPNKFRINWDRLIAEESAARRKYYVFFGLFIDVPVMAPSAARRPYLTWMLPRIPFGHRNTFVYLFSAALFRSEIGGILVRIFLLGGLVCYMSADYASWSGWGAALAYGLSAVIYGVQLSGLRSVHRHSVWKHVYPLPDAQQHEQLLRVDRAALLTGLLLLWLPAAVPLIAAGVYLPPIVMLVAALAYAATRPARLRKKLRVEADEE